MVKKDFVRFALMIDDNGFRNFETAVLKIIQLVMVEANEFLSVSQTAQVIKERYKLQFSEDEISSIIGKNESLFCKSKKDNIPTYFINEKEKNRLLDNGGERDFDAIIDDFINVYEKEMKQLSNVNDLTSFVKNSVVSFLYDTFNASASDILRLVNNKRLDDENLEQLTGEDRRAVYLFLKWNNETKNRYVYKLIESSYEYCLLTLKNNNTPLKEMISSKLFIIDTNVILSLIGINGEDKKNAVLGFFKKCKEFDISIAYTNYSFIESRDTISSLVDRLKAFIDEDENELSFNSTNIVIISSLYDKYIIETGDEKYSGFKNHLLAQLKSSLFDYDMIEIKDDFVKSNIDQINKYSSELKQLKEQKSFKKRSPKSIEHDVVNFLNVASLKKKGCATLIECKTYFVTFDGVLCMWARDKSKGTPSPVINPNILYSLLLRFSSRTEDDEKSFNEFLSASLLYYYDNEKAISAKTLIAKAIKKDINASEEVKKRIYVFADTIVDRYAWSSDNSDIDVEKVLDESSLAVAEEIEKEKNKEINDLNIKHKEEIQKAFREGEQKGNELFVKQLAEDKTKKSIFIRRTTIVFVSIIFVASIIALVLVLVLSHNGDEPFYTKVGFYLSVCGVVLPFVFYIINSVITKTFNISISFWNVDRDKLFNKHLSKIKKKFTNTKQ